MSLTEKALAISALEQETIKALNEAQLDWDTLETNEVYLQIKADFEQKYLLIWNNEDTCSTRFFSLFCKVIFR